MSTENRELWLLIKSLAIKMSTGILTRTEAENVLHDYHVKRMLASKRERLGMFITTPDDTSECDSRCGNCSNDCNGKYCS